MVIFGLTGSIGMGKSTAASVFRDHGVAVFDADQAVHDLYEGEAVGAIEAAFPGTTRQGRVDRAILSHRLADDPTLFAGLEAIVHPLVRERERSFLLGEADKGARFAVLEIPLLFETGADRLVDVVVVVSASAAVQRRRVLERGGMSAAKLELLLSRQLSDHEKRARADFVVDTGGSLQQSADEIARILNSLKDRDGRAFEAHWARG